MSKLSENIKNLRILRKLSQKELAALIERSPNTISNWEKGSATPDADVLEPLCRVFKVNPNQLLGWESCKELEDFMSQKKEILMQMDSLQKQKEEIENKIRECAEQLNRR